MEPLLVIEVQDLNCVPVVKYKGKEITGKVHVEYLWHTKTEADGQHEYELEYGIKPSDEEVPIVKTLCGVRGVTKYETKTHDSLLFE